MAQLFSRNADFLLRFGVIGGGILVLIAAVFGWQVVTAVPLVPPKQIPDQPVFFSHETHVGTLEIDCRYCHESVETSSFAGIPPVSTCMGCHEHVWRNSPLLVPVRESYREQTPLVWTRVYALRDFVFFDHSIHVTKGFACETCHGRVDRMPQIWQVRPMTMQWCLDCHREPERYIRPRESVFELGWKPPPGWNLDEAKRLVGEYRVRRVTDCSACHW